MLELVVLQLGGGYKARGTLCCGLRSPFDLPKQRMFPLRNYNLRCAAIHESHEILRENVLAKDSGEQLSQRGREIHSIPFPV